MKSASIRSGLKADEEETTPLKGFSARVIPGAVLPAQIEALKSPSECPEWLEQVARGISSWGFDARTSAHASDAGYSSDAEGTGYRDPIYPAIELLSLSAAAFFVPAHAWQIRGYKLRVAAWMQSIPLHLVPLASAGRIIGLPARDYTFAYRGGAHGKGSAYHFFPEAVPDTSPINS
ncbi:MAG: hypothetical protein M3463_10505 [Verrucomicrobiota bacterium]|nr:hypothetical protein [Verrucomicrobiota bacterium]